MSADFRFKFRRGTAAQWATANPVLLDGEPGLETDTGRLKLGDGGTPWSDLPYVDTTGTNALDDELTAELATKADATATTAALATKANAATVGALTTRVDTTETRVGTVENEVGGRLGAATLNSTFETKGASLTKLGREQQAAAAEDWLRPFHMRLGQRHTARVPIVWVGDSTVEGAGISDLSLRSPEALQRALRARLPLKTPITPVTGVGSRYYPVDFAGGSLPDAWTFTGSPQIRSDFGFGRRNARFSAAGTASITFTGTDATLFYSAEYNTAGSFTYAIDGGAAQTVTMTAITDTTAISGRTVNFTGLSAGSHTIVFSWVSGVAHVNGLWVFDGDYAKGVHVIEAAHSGFAATTDFAGNRFWVSDLRTVTPALVLIQLGFNDQRIRNVSSATFKASLQQIISDIRSYVTGRFSIGLVANYVPTGSFTEPWSAYVQVMRDLADADPLIGLIDLSLRMEATTAGNADGAYQADLLHPSTTGHDYIGNVVASAIIPR